MGHLDYQSGQWVHDAKDDPDFDAHLAAVAAPPPAAPAIPAQASAADRARAILAARAGTAPPMRQIVMGDDGLVRPYSPDAGQALRAADIGLASPTAIAAPAPGLVEPGNIDLTTRPDTANPDGSHSSVRSMSFSEGGPEILVPTIADDGRQLTEEQAIAQYRQTGKHLGKFKTPDAATAYAQALHRQQAGEVSSPLARPSPAAPMAAATPTAEAPPMAGSVAAPGDQREVVVGDDGLVRPARKEIAARARDARDRRRNRKDD